MIESTKMMKFRLWWYFNITYHLFRNKYCKVYTVYSAKERLVRYKEALEVMTSISKRSHLWFCLHFTQLYLYPEIYRHRPLLSWSAFYFPKGEFGNQVRLEILKQAIKKLENAEDYPKSTWLRWYDNDKSPKL